MIDIRVDDTWDLAISNGDLLVSNCDRQNQGLLIETCPGEWKQHPTRGVGAPRYVEHPDDGELARRIQTELTQDGMDVDSIDIKKGVITIQASYE